MVDGAKPKYLGQERWLRDVEDILRVSSKPRVGEQTKIAGKEVRFNQTMMLDLLRRRESGTESDGLRSRSYDGAGGGGSSELTQTEAAALRGLPGDKPGDDGPDNWSNHEVPDPIGRRIERALEHLDTAARSLRNFEEELGRILNAGARAGERPSQIGAGPCHACGRDVPGTAADRLRSSYCDRAADLLWSGCYRIWLERGRPDRMAFERWVQGEIIVRREALAAESSTAGGQGFYAVSEIDALIASGSLPSQRKEAS